MVKAINGAQGIEVARKDDTVIFIGYFKEGISSRIAMHVVDARNIFNSTDPMVLSIECEDKRVWVGTIDWKPQGTMLWFIPNQNHDLICVDSGEFKQEVGRLVN